VLDDELSEREPALAQLARAAVSGLQPAGPELCRRPEPIALRGRPGVESPKPLCAQELGLICTRPRAPAGWMRRDAKCCSSMCCALPSRPSAYSEARMGWCGSP
jgi:hypothetical protein